MIYGLRAGRVDFGFGTPDIEVPGGQGRIRQAVVRATPLPAPPRRAQMWKTRNARFTHPR